MKNLENKPFVPEVFLSEKFGELQIVEVNGKLFFSGTDVAKALGYSNPRDAISRHCDFNGVVKHDTIKRHSTRYGKEAEEIISVAFINEGNVYRLICRSKLKEAAEFEAQDKKRKEAIDARNEAESFVFQTEDALKQVGDSVDAADKSAVEADIAAVKSFLDAHKEAETMTEADVAELKAAQEKLTQSAQKVFAKMYEQAQAAQGATGAGPNPGAGPDMGSAAGANTGAGANGADDDVIDADFKEV